MCFICLQNVNALTAIVVSFCQPRSQTLSYRVVLFYPAARTLKKNMAANTRKLVKESV